jgi:hypothetical protein
MSIETWGDMNKSQIDATKIEERISEMIAEHEADPEAHLGEDESLESHRAESIIDHPAGAVLSDKTTMTEVDVNTNFMAMTGWTPSGDYDNAFFPGVRLGSNYPSASGTKLTAQEGLCEHMFQFTKDYLLEFSATFADSGKATFFCGLSNVDFPASGNTMVGFKLVDGVIKGIFGKGTTFYSTNAFSGDVSEPNIYRVQYDSYTKIFSFYVNGLLLGSYDATAQSGTTTTYFRIDLKESEEYYCTAFIYYFRASREV